MVKTRITTVLKLLSSVLIAALLFSSVAGMFTPPASSGEALSFEAAFANALTMGARLDSDHFIYIIMCLFPFTVFEVMFGSVFANDFSVTGVYVFTRGASRTKWYIKKCAFLLLFAAVFSAVLFAGGAAVLAAKDAEITNMGETVSFVAQTALAHTLIYFTLTLTLNVLTVAIGSSYAFTAVNAVLVGMAFAVLSCDPENLGWSFKLNFIPNLIPSWHSISQPSWQSAQVEYPQGFDNYFTAAYFAAMCAVVFVIGLIVINRTDISVRKKEAD